MLLRYCSEKEWYEHAKNEEIAFNTDKLVLK